MPLRIALSPEQLALETAADRILDAAPPDAGCPTYTERQLRRHACVAVSLEDIVDRSMGPTQALRDELCFLAAVTPLQRDARAVLRLWTDGWSQEEIAGACGMSQQRVSQRLRRALAACYDSTPISFRRFSHHTIYRPPRRRGVARPAEREEEE